MLAARQPESHRWRSPAAACTTAAWRGCCAPDSKKKDFRFFSTAQVSPGDGGLSYGQAAVAAAIVCHASLTSPTEFPGGSITFARRTSVTIAQWSIKSTIMFFIFLAAFCGAVHARAQQSENEQAVWKMETTYWEDVKVLDLDSYRALWHENFVSWPYSSSQPARKDHITDLDLLRTPIREAGCSRLLTATVPPASPRET